MNAAIDGKTYKYWAWYGLHSDSVSGIGLAGSNDLVNWTKYSGNPVISTSDRSQMPECDKRFRARSGWLMRLHIHPIK